MQKKEGRNKYDRHIMLSWTKDEYSEACYGLVKDNLIDENKTIDNKENIINNKFLLAGHFAQWFFGSNRSFLNSEIEVAMHCTDSIGDLLGGTCGIVSPIIHRLIAIFHESVITSRSFVSHVVARKLVM